MFRRAGLLVLLALVAPSLTASALEPVWTNLLDEDSLLAAKNSEVSGTPDPRSHTAGEDIATAIPIPGLPFVASGNSCAYQDDYNEECPLQSCCGPDVVYSYTPSSDGAVNIRLCDSAYDTKLFVYLNAWPHLRACNDNACGNRSELIGVPVVAGNTYYIVVDGYGLSCGDYVLNVDNTVQVVECPPDAAIEGEPECSDGYVDQYDSGCSALPDPVFYPLYGTSDGSPLSVCGTSGTFLFEDNVARDTDWYQLWVSEESTITFECAAEFPLQMLLLDGNGGCDDPAVLASTTAGPVPDVASFSYACAPGVYWYWVAPSAFTGVPCGADYIATITGYIGGPISTHATSWGSVKGLYR